MSLLRMTLLHVSPESSQSGFTLIELTAVIAIIVISLCFTIPGMMSSLTMEKSKSATIQIRNFLSEAKSLAMVRNQVLRIDIDEGDAKAEKSWVLVLRSGSKKTGQPGQILQQHKGSLDFDMHSGYLHNQIFIDGVKGKMSSGFLLLSRVGSDGPALKIITSYGAGRIRVCAVGEVVNGFPLC